jgi:hypothetical protein
MKASSWNLCESECTTVLLMETFVLPGFLNGLNVVFSGIGVSSLGGSKD